MQDIPRVLTENPHKGYDGEDYNYYFVQIKDSEEKDYIYANGKLFITHEKVFESFQEIAKKRDFDPSKFRCVGGGRILIYETRKIIKACDYSHNFGKFNKEIVKSLLEDYVKENLPGFSVIVE